MTATPFVFTAWASAYQQRIEQVLEHTLPASDTLPQRLHSAMRYAVLGGGKRVRALLAYAAAEFTGATAMHADTAAAAVELIHAFSLVHDDMPCMDNDDLRRGKPSCHKAYDDATALLVGDALQSLAFECLTHAPTSHAVQQIQLLAQATGSRGMCGGQSIDLQSTGQTLSVDALATMHQYKTGALIGAATLLGAYAANQPTDAQLQALGYFSERMGLAFQVVDDILDSTTDTQTLGKTAGKDSAQAKSTYVTLLGLDAARQLVQQLHQDTLTRLAPFGETAVALRGLATFICERPF